MSFLPMKLSMITKGLDDHVDIIGSERYHPSPKKSQNHLNPKWLWGYMIGSRLHIHVDVILGIVLERSFTVQLHQCWSNWNDIFQSVVIQLKCYVPINSKVQHPPPPSRATPGHLNFWRLASSNSLPLGQKSRSNARPISTELHVPLLKDKFRLISKTFHAFQREMCCDNTLRLLLKTLLKELFPNKGEILFCKSIKPCKSRKDPQEYYTRTRDKSGSDSPPFQGNVQIPPSVGAMHSQMPGVCQGGGCLSFNLTGT